VGSADAIFQNLNVIDDEEPDFLFVFGADHIYRMDPSQMLDAHIESGAGVTVAGIRVPRVEASAFGVIEIESTGTRIARFLEKPTDPRGLADDPDSVLASMGNYVFTTDTLLDALATDAEDADSRHDVGGDLIPQMVDKGLAHVYDFTDNEVPGVTERDRGYWRDVGTLDTYFDAHMDLVSVEPVFNLYNEEWPTFTVNDVAPPAKVVAVGDHGPGEISESLLSNGVIVSGAYIHRSVLSPGVRVAPGATLEGAIVMDNVSVGEGATIRNAVIDKNVVVPPGAVIGVDPERDEARFTRSPGGIVALAKNEEITEPE
ncbi:MAG: glucose-1-phosphate adenylyltransferase, partial [Acidimicrobiia bacterium]|nr:glucose-1-phosphate adenylyltransferase [Acidimicrobiia bacterium]